MAADLTNLSDTFVRNIPSGMGHIGLAISGGSDSVALLKLAASYATKQKTSPQFTVLCVDHQLREGSARDAEFVMRLAKELDVNAHTLIWKGEKPATGIQNAARHARYQLMVEKCRLLGVDALMTAHTQDDQAETFLMRLKRGSGLDGLSAMSVLSEFDGFPILRPLLGVARKSLRGYLSSITQDWIDDPSNKNTDFERVRVRQQMPALEDMGYGAEQLALSAGRLLRARQFIETQVDDISRQVVTWFETGFCQFDNAQFREVHDEIALRILSRILLSVGGREREAQLQKLERALETWRQSEMGTGFTLAGCRIVVRKDKTLVVREDERQHHTRTVLPIAPGHKMVWDRRFLCEVLTKHNSPLNEADNFSVRALGEAGWQYAKGHFGESDKVPSYIGHGLVSLWCGENVVCVPHIGLCDENIQFNAQFLPRGVTELPKLHAYL